MNTISREELQTALGAGHAVTLVETLRFEAFERGHLPGAIQLHQDDVETRAAALLPDRNAAIVTYCSNPSCRASAAVQAKLARLGYTNVARYPGGKQDWSDAGLPLEHATPQPQRVTAAA